MPHRPEVVETLRTGFQVPDSYLGVANRDRTRATTLDHVRGTSVPEFDAWAVENGLANELNLPLVANGRMEGALVIYRTANATFDPSEIALAERLGKQLALAVAAARLAEEARDAAILREREAAALAHAAELQRANEALRRREILLVATNEATRMLLGAADDLASTLLAAFEHIAEAAGMDRLLVLVERPASDGAGSSHFVYTEYTAPGVSSRAAVGLTEQRNDHFPSLVDALRAGRSYWIGIDDLEDEGRENFLRLGNMSTAGVPIFVGGLYFGLCAFDHTEAAKVPDALELDMLEITARAVASAFERERVAAERTAVARERANELETANEALRKTVTRLAEAADLEVALKEALRNAAAAVGAGGGALGLYVPEERGFRTPFEIVDGEVQPAREGRLYSLDEPAMARAWEALHTPDCFLWCRPDSPYLTDDTKAYMRDHGFAAAILTPLLRGGTCIGYLGFVTRSERELLPAKRVLVRSLADQMALMLEMDRLADGLREAALARERLSAARTHLASLHAANDALRRGAERVGQEGGLDDLLGAFLLEAVRVSGARSGGILEWRNDRYVRHVAIARDGALVPPAEWHEEPMIRESAEVLNRGDGEFARLLLDQPVTRSIVDSGWAWWPAAADYHAKRGHREVWNVPCGFKGRLRAHLGLAFREPREMDPMIVSTLTSLAQQMTLALELTDLAEQAKRAAIEIETERAVATERNRMAREMHDGLAQSFTAIGVQLEAANELASSRPDLAKACLDRVGSLAQQGLTEARRAVYAFEEDAMAKVDFVGVLTLLVETSTRGTRAPAELFVRGAACPLTPKVSHHLVRITQESLANAQRHARATRIAVELDFEPEGIRVRISDDGEGFDPDTTDGGSGLRGMRERAATIGAEVRIDSAVGRGTQIQLHVPRGRS